MTARALLLALFFLLLAALWVRQAELIAGVTNISETVPSMPAIGALLLLALLARAGGRLPWLANFSPAEKVVVYGVVSVGVMPLALTWLRWLIPFPLVPYYFATPANGLARLQPYLPAWLAPRDPELVRRFFEGAPDGRVPWSAWIVPLAAWFLLLMLLWITLLCLLVLLRRQWTERERLAYPLLYLPLNLAGAEKSLGPTFFRDPLMGLGFGLACLHNLLNILAAFTPQVPAVGQQLDLRAFFPDPPWDRIQSLNVTHRLELIGLGYLMPAEILFTAAFTYLAGQLLRVFLFTRGHEIRGFPYAWEQSAGAFLAFVLVALWLARDHLRRVFRKALRGDLQIRDEDEPLSYRAALLGFVAGTAGVLGWAWLAGMRLAPAAAFFGVIVLFALGYARLRAESGAPILRAFPPYQAMLLPVGLVGSETLGAWAGQPTLVVWSSLYGIAAHSLVPGPAYHLELLKLGDQTRIPRRRMAAVSVAALAVGVLLAGWLVLATAYDRGALHFFGPGSSGAQYALAQYGAVARWPEAPQPADPARGLATGFGFLIAGALSLARLAWLWMPLHPTGYLLGLTMGHHSWAPFLLVWALKTLIVRLGGPGLYRRLIPAFLGLALGEFFAAGLVWGLVGAFFPEAARSYWVWYL